MSFVRTLIPLMKNGRISLISIEQRPESYTRLRNEVDGKKKEMAYAKFTVVQLRDTIPTFGLPCLSNIFKKGANPVRILKIVGCTA